MAFRSYVIQKYRHTHENIFFHDLEKKLRIEFDPDDGLHVLVGNINCNGNEIDALFISKGQVVVIDFKDYKGELTFSENNPWLIENNGRQAFVAGGSAHKNPLQQIKTYKFGLLKFLKENDQELLSKNRNDINWGHISGCVLFHDVVTYKEEDLPDSVKPWFKIADPTNIVQLLISQFSTNLRFTDSEIESILLRLDVRPENTYNPQKIEIETESSITKGAGNFELIERIVSEFTPKGSTEKVIEYLKTIIQLERQKSPNFESKLYQVQKEEDTGDKIVIDIRKNGEFLEIYKNNQAARFPNDIFVGVNFSLGSETYPLLYNVIPLTSISDYTTTIDPSYFEINDSVLKDLQLPEEYISNLNNEISSEKSFPGKCRIIENELGIGSINLTTTFSLGLSSGTWFTAQLYSELKKLSKNRTSSIPSYLSSFLHNSNIPKNPEVTLRNDRLVEITPLNEEQRQALFHSLTEPVTVITGPPGTGKTQLILNLLANIITHDYTALFASKNNKAVNNVEERLSEIFSEGFLPRFGSKQYIRDNTKGKILGYLNAIQQKVDSPVTNKNGLKTNITEFNRKREELRKSKDRLSEIRREKISLRESISEAKKQYKAWLDGVSDIYKKHVLKNKDIPELDESEIDQIIYTLNNARGFVQGLWFNFFQKNKTFDQLKRIDAKLPIWLNEQIRKDTPLIQTNTSIVYSGLRYLTHLQQQKKNIRSHINKDQEWNKNLTELKSKHEKLKEEYAQLGKVVPGLEEKLEENYDDYIYESSQFVKAIRNDKLGEVQDYEINSYLNFIPDDIPWKDSEVGQFTREAKRFTELFNIVSVTSLSIKSSYPLEPNLFDYVIIDEASQCDVASVVPLLYRAKKVIIIGDNQQLKHITRVNKHEDNYITELLDVSNDKGFRYSEQSLYDYGEVWANTNHLNSIFLPKHYRCHPDIIRFSNTFFYKRQMGKELDILTHNKTYPVKEQGIFWHDVFGELEPRQNINKAEAFKAIELAKHLATENPDASIGIITPFRHQFEFIQNNLDQNALKRIYPLTVHQAQGDEEDIIILSLIIGDETKASLTDFINYVAPYLLNVAVTRARGALHIVGNHKYCINLRDNTPLSQLAQYCIGQDGVIKK